MYVLTNDESIRCGRLFIGTRRNIKEYENISEYMETSLNTTRNYEDYILNAIKFGYTNE